MRVFAVLSLLLLLVLLGGCCYGHASYGVSYSSGYCEPAYCPPPPCGVVVRHGHCGW